MKNLLKNLRQGFTLIEILIVVVIIGILATVAIPTYFKYVEKGYASDAKIQIKNIVMGADLMKQETGSYPQDFQELVEELVTEGFVDLKPSVAKKWGFVISGFDDEDPGRGSVVATSTPEMDGGAEKIIEYREEDGSWTGYGQDGGGEGEGGDDG